MRIGVIALGIVLLAGCSSDDAKDASTSGRGCEATVHVFLELGTNRQRQRAVGDVIDAIPSVVRSKFHSNRLAYREFKELYSQQPQIRDAKGPSDFPSRYEVTLDSGQSVDLFERTVAEVSGIDRLVPGGCATPEAK